MKTIVAISDTHRQHWCVVIPKCDLFIFAGDAEIDSLEVLYDFNEWLGTIKAKNKLVVAGNHDGYLEYLGKEECRKQLSNCIYLENEYVEVDGFKIFGSPFSPLFNDWSYMRTESGLKEIWDTIPSSTEILVTHTMPYGILDQIMPKMNSVGSVTLRNKIKEIHPYIQIGGHLHESYGKYTDYKTDYYNVSVLDEHYKLVNPITIIEV